MTTPTPTAVLALIGTGLAFTAGVLGGPLLFILATLFVMAACLSAANGGYDKGYELGVKDGQAEDVYE